MHIVKLLIASTILTTCLSGCGTNTYKEDEVSEHLVEVDRITGMYINNLEIPEFNYGSIKSYLCEIEDLWNKNQYITILLESEDTFSNNNYLLFLDENEDGKLSALVDESGHIEKLNDRQLKYNFLLRNYSNCYIINLEADIEDLDKIYWADGTKLNIEKDFNITKEHLNKQGYYIVNEQNDIGGDYYIEITQNFKNNLLSRERSFIISSNLEIPSKIEFLNREEQVIEFKGLVGVESISYDSFERYHTIFITFKNEAFIVPSTEEEFRDWIVNKSGIHYISWEVNGEKYKAPIIGVIVDKEVTTER